MVERRWEADRRADWPIPAVALTDRSAAESEDSRKTMIGQALTEDVENLGPLFASDARSVVADRNAHLTLVGNRKRCCECGSGRGVYARIGQQIGQNLV